MVQDVGKSLLQSSPDQRLEDAQQRVVARLTDLGMKGLLIFSIQLWLRPSGRAFAGAQSCAATQTATSCCHFEASVVAVIALSQRQHNNVARA